MKAIPKTQEELDAIVEVAGRHRGIPDSETIMDMLRGSCVGGNLSPFTLSYRYMGAPWMRNPLGNTHGGLIATMFDNAMGRTAHSMMAGQGFAPTGELQVSYIKPVPVNRPLIIRVQVDQAGSRMIRMRGEMRDEAEPDTLYATAFGVNCPLRAAK